MTSQKNHKAAKKGVLVLSDGSLWPGYSFGAETTELGECVFHTAHSGYQEVLTDPSYRKQMLVFTSSQIGNQGFHEDDFESERIWASGCIARDYSDIPVHFRKQKSLDEVLKENKVPSLFGVDTRRLVLHLRNRGNLWGALSTDGKNVKELQNRLSKIKSMEGLSLTSEVSTKVVYPWNKKTDSLIAPSFAKKKGLRRCVVMDFGVKRQILRYLVDAGFEEVLVVPSKTSAAAIRELKPDALFLSNGPGDPAAEKEIIREVKLLLYDFPILGICLGHQILALALGLKTFKLKFGHHGANHPVKNLISDRVEITSQNHGFAVSPEKSADLEITHMNLNDQTIEGFRHKKYPIRAIQFHPEAGPGPLDSRQIFESFQKGFAA
ncbi:MAG: Carbamoyl-phosphate synthase small chain [Bacteriovoracaceae bacterium]|nr:Carbamoyl-phosphate synthase small chain [Bacteriovoracaceae bacterium]